MITTREQLHRLVDIISEADLSAAKRALERFADRPSLEDFLASAELDDEPSTPDEEAAVAEGRADAAAGRIVTDEDLRRELGLDDTL